MIENPECPVCGALEWTKVGEHTYFSERMAKENPGPERVLFGLWVPGEKDLRVRFMGCRVCGMMIYAPRPSAKDYAAMYGLSPAGPRAPSRNDAPRRTKMRADRVFKLVSPHLKRPAVECRVLDFGGGNGCLMAKFAKVGAECEVIDYCMTPIEGVRHIGRTERDVPEGVKYDAIICSHVVEHLAEPASVLQSLAGSLKPDGVIYVEVPVEVRKNMPSAAEPVTHCNFFIPESLRTLMQETGYKVVNCRQMPYPHPSGGWALCAGAIAAPGPEPVVRSGIEPLRRYLNPSTLHTLRIHSMLWRGLPRRLAARLTHKLASWSGSRPPRQPLARNEVIDGN